MTKFYGIITILFICSTSLAEPAEKPLFHRVAGNLLQNSGFEHNWFNHELANRSRFLLLQASDMGVAECDGHVDYWTMREGDRVGYRRRADGLRSLRFDGAGGASQMVRFAGENSPLAGGGALRVFHADGKETRLAGASARYCGRRVVPDEGCFPRGGADVVGEG